MSSTNVSTFSEAVGTMAERLVQLQGMLHHLGANALGPPLQFREFGTFCLCHSAVFCQWFFLE